MNGRHQVWIAAGALALLLAGAVYGDDHEKPAPPGAEEMEAMMAQGRPGEHHQHLAMLVGEWTYSAKMWMPGAPEPAVMGGTMTAESLLGGRFVQNTWKGDFMGQPFHGIGVDGYDNAKQHYTSTWRDNFGTYTLHYTGACDASGKVRTTLGSMTDPATGEEVKDKGKMTFRDDGTVLMESWRVAPDGTESKSMEITLVRK